MQYPFNVIVYKAGLDDPISPFATPSLLVCGLVLLSNGPLMTAADSHRQNGFLLTWVRAARWRLSP